MPVTRRNFVAGAVYGLFSLIGAVFAASVGTYLFGTPQQEAEGWAEVGPVEDLQPGAPELITFEKSRIDGWKFRNEKASAWVVLDRSGGITAFSPTCTHLGCAYHWEVEKHRFLCPCHGSAFSVNGQVLAGPAQRPLDRYPVRLEGSRLWLGPAQRSAES